MKKLFNKIGNWFKSLFKKEVESSPEEKKNPTGELFDKMYEKGLFDKDPKMEKSVMDEDLVKSAKKLNEYKDMRRSIESAIKPKNEEFEGIRLDEEAKDKTHLKNQEMKITDEEEKKQK